MNDEQAELDRIILHLLGKDDEIGKRTKPVVIYNNDEIVKLDLSGLKLSILPDGFFNNFYELRELDLSDNEFKIIPDGIFDNLPNLKRLILSNTIDPSEFVQEDKVVLPPLLFTKLINLKELDISNNQLDGLNDDVFAKVNNLEKLKLSYNFLQNLPSSIGALHNLSYLDLDSNFLPVEQSGEYKSHTEVQSFIYPYKEVWLKEKSKNTTTTKDTDDASIEQELQKAFSMLEDLF
ncbi:MAG: leucine-rich repeat domain-containing protein [Candidatus Heimdallarchaeota archaeon]|nr:leucine-rich repeat domain-containing protein [Candidatus Heimdallarchaeota archaeon]MDH5646436.1 leucine-rich repeat domain-containing protein [Candidatus Heimdallarchaeota archaeon]